MWVCQSHQLVAILNADQGLLGFRSGYFSHPADLALPGILISGVSHRPCMEYPILQGRSIFLNMTATENKY